VTVTYDKTLPSALGSDAGESPHIPVLWQEVVAGLNVQTDGVYVDGTFGNGGYSRALLEAGAGFVFAFDRDPAAQPVAETLRQDYPKRFKLCRCCFGAMETALSQEDQAQQGIAGLTFDLGVSSMQLDQPERGFSFRFDGPLDMRMGQTQDQEETAADVLARLSEEALADVIHAFGEEPAARRIAKAIVLARDKMALTRTEQLADLVRGVLGPGRKGAGHRKGGPSRIDPATKTFQALRIFVNDELGELARGMVAATRLLRPGGRLAIVAFHSLEDRMVKNYFRRFAGEEAQPSRHHPHLLDARQAPCLSLVKRGAIKPSAEEEKRNPRSRSARLRLAERTAASLPQDLAEGSVAACAKALIGLSGLSEHGQAQL